MNEAAKIQVTNTGGTLVSRVEDETGVSKMTISSAGVTGWVQKRDLMIDLEAAHLTLHHLQTLIRHGAFSALRCELQSKEGRERCAAALQTALDLLEWEGVVLTRLVDKTSASELMITRKGITSRVWKKEEGGDLQ